MNLLKYPLLKELGLSENEAQIYELLLLKGPQRPPELVEPSGLGRGNVYNVLQQLVQKGLVTVKEGKLQVYEAVDPSGLRRLLEQKQEETRRLEQTFLTTLPQLTSSYTLSTGKPAIQMFEGLPGMEAALDDSLTAQGEILTYLDPDTLKGAFADINQSYIKRRIARHIKKRILMPDTLEARTYVNKMKNDWTEIHLCSGMTPQFQTAMEVYNDKVAFHTLDVQKPISFIIENPFVARLHRAQFEALWQITPPPTTASQ